METVLLIENDPANLVALAMVLRSLGYTVLEADSRSEACSKLIRRCHGWGEQNQQTGKNLP